MSKPPHAQEPYILSTVLEFCNGSLEFRLAVSGFLKTEALFRERHLLLHLQTNAIFFHDEETLKF